jgi:cell division protein ZapD
MQRRAKLTTIAKFKSGLASADGLASLKNDLIIYEFPLNERMRTFIRLEHLFAQVSYFSQGTSEWDSRAAVQALLEAFTIISRSDVRAELLKELERHAKVLARLARSQRIDRGKLQAIVDKIDFLSHRLREVNSKLGVQMLECGLFKSILQRSAIPGGTCCFDLPGYHFWLQQPAVHRQQDLSLWLEPLLPVEEGIAFVLDTIRQSALPSQEQAQAGFFQQNLDHSLPFQMIRVGLARDLPYYAEISGGKHRFTVRFMELEFLEKPKQTNSDVSFQLTRCLF